MRDHSGRFGASWGSLLAPEGGYLRSLKPKSPRMRGLRASGVLLQNPMSIPNMALSSMIHDIDCSSYHDSNYNLTKGGLFLYDGQLTVESTKLEHGCRRMYAGSRSFFVLGSEDDHVSTFWL